MELTLDQALKRGVDAHKAGNFQEADRYYTAILKTNPKHADANHKMGVLAVNIGRLQQALPFFKMAVEADSSTEQFWISYIDALIKLNRVANATVAFKQARSNGAKGDSFVKLKKRLVSSESENINVQDPPKEQLMSLVKLYNQQKLQEVYKEVQVLTKQYTESLTLWNLMGASAAQIGKLEEAVRAFEKSLVIKPDNADAHYNIGNAFRDQQKLQEAIEAYNHAISIKPDYADAYLNMGNALKDQGKLQEAVEVYKKACYIKPDSADAYFNLGLVLKEQGKLEEAIEAYGKALTIKPDYAEVYNNMGNALQEKGRLKEATEAYNNALSIELDYAKAHLNLSYIKKYTIEDKQFLLAKKLHKLESLSDEKKCKLTFALAKMYDDIGKLDQAFIHLSEANALRKKFLKYSINEDVEFFTRLKETQPHFLINTNQRIKNPVGPKPIFILGMPRSGTTLVEQIIASHSEVFGAGELDYVKKFGKKLSEEPISINIEAISEFRQKYLLKLTNLSYGKHFVIDKMPQNFRFIPLICTAFPEAKIIHVQRNAAATCWSNYKQYFSAAGLGYSYDLKDVVSYYGLYSDLMKSWKLEYGDKIYNLNYEKLTTDQEGETRKLIDLLGLDWDEACLSPHKNKRSVKTASQRQVRQKIYQGSSEAWRKYEPYLGSAFDSLPSS